jgi:hypothetical protein|nr:MAG TPA: hypothetical protein [Caudoviricetes sp.]
MRKARGLAGVGEGEREGTSYQQNSIDKRFKTVFCRFSHKIKTYSALKQHNVDYFHKIKYNRSLKQHYIGSFHQIKG